MGRMETKSCLSHIDPSATLRSPDRGRSRAMKRTLNALPVHPAKLSYRGQCGSHVDSVLIAWRWWEPDATDQVAKAG
jgi:hypothetical protein